MNKAIYPIKYLLLVMAMVMLCSYAKSVKAEEDTQPSSYADNINYLKYNDSNKQLEKDLYFAKDIAIGSLDAPITLVDYYSFSCVHCATFNEQIFSAIKSNYIDSGKVLLILRDFPMDRASLNASMLLHCFNDGTYCDNKEGCENRDIFTFNSVMLASRKNWNNKNALELVNEEAKNSNMSAKEISQCLKDEELQNQVVQNKLIGIRHLSINAVPTLFINGKVYEGKHTLEDFTAYLNELLAEKK